MIDTSAEYLLHDDCEVEGDAAFAAAPESWPPGRPPLEPRRARRYAKLKDQLSNPFVMAEDVGQLTFEADRIRHAFTPRNDWQDWLVAVIATLMFRLTRCDRIERKLRDMASFRAIGLWEEDQRLAVEILAVKLPPQPGRTVAQLRQTPAGIDWLIDRWEGLARVEPAAWGDREAKLACQLLGGDPSIDATGADFARARARELRDLAGRVEEADAITRGLVEADLADAHVAGLKQIRSDARRLHRQLKYYIDQFHVEHPDRWDDPRRKPGDVCHPLQEAQRSRKTAYPFTEREPANPSPTPPNPTPPPATPKTNPSSPPRAETNPSSPPRAETNPASTRRDKTNPSASPRRDETNPSSSRCAETNPSSPPGAHKTNPFSPRRGMTNPFAVAADDPAQRPPGPAADPAGQPTAAAAAGPTRPSAFGPQPTYHDYAYEKGRNHSRPTPPGAHSRAYARQLRQARRETERAIERYEFLRRPEPPPSEATSPTPGGRSTPP